MRTVRKYLVWLNIWRIAPAYLFSLTCRFRNKCAMDLDRWILEETELLDGCRLWQFGYCMLHKKQSRNIFLNRLKRNPVYYLIVRLFFPPLQTCHVSIAPEDLGGGFVLHNGFSTMVSPMKMGERCLVCQQVTIGFRGNYAPVIGNDVYIGAGAIILGNIHIGDHAKIGAGAVVVHDVPAYATVVGPAAQIIRIRETV